MSHILDEMTLSERRCPYTDGKPQHKHTLEVLHLLFYYMKIDSRSKSKNKTTKNTSDHRPQAIVNSSDTVYHSVQDTSHHLVLYTVCCRPSAMLMPMQCRLGTLKVCGYQVAVLLRNNNESKRLLTCYTSYVMYRYEMYI